MSIIRSLARNPWRTVAGWAALAALGCWAVIAYTENGPIQQGPEMVEVCVAADDIPAGTHFSRDAIATR